MSKYKKFIFFSAFFVTGYWLLVTCSVEAASLNLVSSVSEISVGQKFRVDLVLNSEESINALEGKISFPGNLELSTVQDSNSIVNFWIEKPAVKQENMSFSGVIPGGYAGHNGLVFSLTFKAVSEGSGIVGLNGSKALLNDGQGTQADLKISNYKFLISNQAPSSKLQIPSSKDIESPEDFGPEIAKDPDIFNGQWFIVFATQDKGSGIDHYEIAEERGNITQDYTKLPWQTTESPYILKDQGLKSYVYVKAVDLAGNIRVVYLSPSYIPWYKKPAVDIIVGLGIVIVVLLIRWLWQRFLKKKH